MGRSGADSGGPLAAAPAHFFDCPPNFFDSAVVYRGDAEETAAGAIVAADLAALSVAEGDEPAAEAAEAADGGDAVAAGGIRWTCVSCRAVFASSEEQRSHFKLDYHRLNVKRRVVGKDPVTEEEFEAVAEGHSAGVNDDLSSISGSDEETEDSDQTFSQPQRQIRSNRIYFVFPAGRQIFSVWRSILLAEKEQGQSEKESSSDPGDGHLFVNDADLLLRLKSLIKSHSQIDANALHQPKNWIILLAAGGHFAGIVVKAGTGEVLDHHTFHRYVVRAKAGGRQSTQDKSGRAPKSAGSSLRRYNEAALQKEIRNLLSSWDGFLQSASHVFVHAPSANGQALFGGEKAPLSYNDLRIRRIPFTTRRPTFKEAKRVYHILSALSYGVGTNTSHEAAKGTMDGRKEEAKRGIKAGDGRQGKGKELLSTKRQNHPKGAAGSLEPSSADVATVSVSSDAGLNDDGSDLQKTSTRLHEAARTGNCELVLKLLEDGSDPSSKDEGGYTPYARAGDKETRNVFRRFMARHPDLWDWQAASVPSALTEEMEASQAAKQAEKKEREKERKKLKKEQERAKEAEKKAAELATAALANVRGTALPKKAAKTASTSSQAAAYQEALAKAQADERERRAAAAEVRMRSLMASRESQHGATAPTSEVGPTDPRAACSCCGDSMTGKTPFHRFSYQYCSTTCVQVHKKYLESQ